MRTTTGRLRRPTRRVVAAATIATLVLLVGCTADRDATADAGSTERDDAAQDIPVGEEIPNPGDDEEDAGAVALRFTFTGTDGDEGCSYAGPTTVPAGRVPSTLVHAGGAGEATVTLARLADGHTHEDFVAYLDGLTDAYPAVVPDEDRSASAHDWMEGDWREIHHAEPGQEQELEALALSAGRYITFCWIDREGAAHVWPAAPLEVTD